MTIMDQYVIRSTLPISDAYKSGDDSKLTDREKETLEMAAAVLDEIITEDMTDYEKELAVYDWMTHSLQYDTGVLQVIPRTEADADNPYGTLKYHNAVCVGYATTFRLFMQMLDIDCMVVHNTDAYHSWDLVKLDDEWYHVDIYSDQDSGNYANFNMNDEACAQGHDWDRDFFPAAEGTKYNYAIQNAQTVEDIYAVPGLVKAALDEENGSLFLSFDPIDEAHAQQVETMMDGIQSFLYDGGTYGDLWMEWRWIHAAGNQYVQGFCPVVVRQVSQQAAAHKLAFEAAVGRNGTIHMVQALHLVVVQVGVGLDGAEAGEFLLAETVAEVQAQVVVAQRHKRGGHQLQLQQAGTGTGVPHAGDIGHAVIRLEAEGEPIPQRGGVQVQLQGGIVLVIVLGD